MKNILIGLVATGLSCYLSAQTDDIELDEVDAQPATAESRFSLEDLHMFTRLFEQVRQNYVKEVSDAELLSMAIKGMLAQLDPHSEFLGAEKREFLENTSDGTFYGVGLELTMESGELTVVTPLDESPADRAGIKPGDIILEIDGQGTWGMSLAEALDFMEGEQGTEMTLQLGRPGQSKPFQTKLIREKLALASVRVRPLTHDIGYLRIRQFQRATGQEFEKKLTELLDQHPYMTGLILDLRNNPGGILRAAVEVSDLFLNQGVIVSTKGRSEGISKSYYASENILAPNLPLVVLINEGSASASEIVAGALQDHKRAVIMGDISFGKGSVQNVVPVDDTRAIKLTTAHYYTPSGRSIQAQGIFPDVSVLAGEIERVDKGFSVSEASLLRHLDNPEDSGSDTDATTSTETPKLLGLRETLADIEDIQLAQALAFLKGLAVYNRTK